ncbi:MAG: MMPL family transporter, partial [Solirubrobacterales bacterium]|nr:MMPL family transporter [Solirubrobacterales bacterium]
AGGAGALRRGLERLRGGTVVARIRTRRLARGLGNAERLADASGSGHFVLAALDAGSPGRRAAASFAVNLDRGGSAAQIAVLAAGGSVARAGHPLRERLERELPRLERETGGAARLGGPAAVMQDFDSETFGRLGLLVAGLSGITFLVLVLVLRSLLLPLLAVLLNVTGVAAAFGVLVLLFQGEARLGGPGFLDAIMVAGIFSVAFGLAIDYGVFLLTRMREGYSRSGSTDEAVAYGLRRTAGVVAGAAAIMIAVFVAFATSEIASMRQLGIGLAVAVLLAASIVGLVLLPAAIRLCGHASWWLPRWLPARLVGPRPRVGADDDPW